MYSSSIDNMLLQPFFRNAFEVFGRVVWMRVEPQRGQRASVVHDTGVRRQLWRQITRGPWRSKQRRGWSTGKPSEELIQRLMRTGSDSWTINHWTTRRSDSDPILWRTVNTIEWPDKAWWGDDVAAETRAAVPLWVPDRQTRALHHVRPIVRRVAVNVDVTVDGDDVRQRLWQVVWRPSISTRIPADDTWTVRPILRHTYAV